ncbi:MarR family transcriptional regulator [Fundidesulfovibrio butyratiphilus]
MRSNRSCPADGEAVNPSESFGYLLHEISKAWRGLIDEKLRPYGISSASLTVLCSLIISPEPLTQRQLAAEVNVEASTLVHILDRLQAKGLVRREAVAGDRRMRHVVLTDKAKRFFDQLVQNAQVLERRLLDGIPPESVRVAKEVLLTLGERMAVDLMQEKRSR